MDVCVVSKDKKAKSRTIKTKKQVRLKYEQSTREHKKIPVEARFSAHVLTSPGVHSDSYKLGTGSFPRVKLPGHGVNHSPPSRKSRTNLYSPSGLSRPLLGLTLSFLLPVNA